MEKPSSPTASSWLKVVEPYTLYAAWTMALVSTAGSLYFSEVAGLLPCMLCWYQRIAMYPLVVVLLVSILIKDTKAWLYAMPFAIAGWLIAAYHNLLYYGVLVESSATCRAGVSCTDEQMQLFGFLDIPLMSLLGFTFIIFALLIHRKAQA